MPVDLAALDIRLKKFLEVLLACLCANIGHESGDRREVFFLLGSKLLNARREVLMTEPEKVLEGCGYPTVVRLFCFL